MSVGISWNSKKVRKNFLFLFLIFEILDRWPKFSTQIIFWDTRVAYRHLWYKNQATICTCNKKNMIIFFQIHLGLLHTIRLVLYFRKITRGEERIKLSQSPGRNQKNVRKRKKILSLANHDFFNKGWQFSIYAL